MKEISWEDSYEWLNQKRLKGNTLFLKGNKLQAIAEYLEGIYGLMHTSEHLPVTDLGIHLQTLVRDLGGPILNNMGICLRMLSQTELANRAHLLTIEMGLTISKAYFNLAKNFLELKDYAQAKYPPSHLSLGNTPRTGTNCR